jgi:hypothetical protein
MRLAILAVIVTGCASHTTAVAEASPAAREFAAARWVPAQPTYVFASKTLGTAQRSLRDTLDLIGIAVGFELRDASQAVSDLIGVDALHPDPIAAIGIDPHGGWAAFSEDLSPTLVVHLAAPDRMAAFLDRQRQRGMATESVIVAAARGRERTEVVSAHLANGLKLSWAIAGDWMWVHVALPFAHDDGTSWFTASHDPHTAGWSATWAWAQRAAGAAAGVVGFLDLHGAVANAVASLPDAVACAKQIPAVGRVAVAIDGDERHVAARLAFSVRSTAKLSSLILPAPSGWAATAAHAAIAAQWNLDLPAVRSWLAPCLASAGVDLTALDDAGVRAGRGLVLDFDPDGMSGTGAIALDVTRPAFFERQLDRIPLRHTLERMRTFGTTPGVQIAIPFGVTVEYVLDDHRAVAALGDGMLARVFAPAAPAPAPAPAPLIAIDLAPPAMSVQAWGSVLHALVDHELSGPPGPATRRMVDRLMRWRDLHLGVTVEPSELVVSLSGHRR